MVVSIEDNGRVGGVGAALAQLLREARVATPLRDFGLPQQFLTHGKRADLLLEAGLSAQDVARSVVESVASLEPAAVVG
jgi:1-deoxy-D-xylulose-5-phosphate synthase